MGFWDRLFNRQPNGGDFAPEPTLWNGGNAKKGLGLGQKLRAQVGFPGDPLESVQKAGDPLATAEWLSDRDTSGTRAGVQVDPRQGQQFYILMIAASTDGVTGADVVDVGMGRGILHNRAAALNPNVVKWRFVIPQDEDQPQTFPAPGIPVPPNETLVVQFDGAPDDTSYVTVVGYWKEID